MAIFDEEKLKTKVRRLYEAEQDRKAKQEIRKNRELLRRRVHAQLYSPAMCSATNEVNKMACGNYALPGVPFCAEHGGSAKGMRIAAQTRLLYLTEQAIRTLSRAMGSFDMNIALKAAIATLDRTGFHPSATLEIKETPQDLSTASFEELKNRATQLLKTIEQPAQSLDTPPEAEEDPVYRVIEEDSEKKDSVH